MRFSIVELARARGNFIAEMALTLLLKVSVY